MHDRPASLVRRYCHLTRQLMRCWRHLLMAAACTFPVVPRADPVVVGWIEPVRIVDASIDVPAKLDTGAEHSSLHAPDLVLEERDGVTWVRFLLRDDRDRQAVIDRQVVRFARIKRHGGEPLYRPVIRLTLCLDGQHREVDVNLVDRSGFDYPLLVGRSFLRTQFLVDAGQRQLTVPRCLN